MKLTFQVYRQRSTEKVRPRVSCSSPKPDVSQLTFWSEDLSDNYDSGQGLDCATLVGTRGGQLHEFG